MSTNILIERVMPDIANLAIESIVDSSVPNKRTYFMEGIFIQGDLKNHNGRIYPRNEIERAVKTLNEKISSGCSILGEVDHPSNLQINLDRVSHVITEMRMHGSNGIGKLKIIEELPMGRICKTLLENGIKLGVSSRGTGEVGYDGNVKGFDIVTVDIVAQPSAPEAYPKLVMEALESYKHYNQIFDMAKNASVDPLAEKYLQKDIIGFINSLKI